MFLRQTGQLYLEAFTLAHNRVYTIGPSFRQDGKLPTVIFANSY